MKTGAEYRASLRDGRATYFEGQRVEDRGAPRARALGRRGGRHLRPLPFPRARRACLMGVPGSAAELKARIPLLQRADLVANVTYQSIMTLLTAASRMADCAEYVARFGAYVDHAQRIVTRKFYDLAGAKRKALALAGLAEELTWPPTDKSQQFGYRSLVELLF